MSRLAVPSLAGGLMIAGLAGMDAAPARAAGGRFVPGLSVGSFIEQRNDPVDPTVRLSRISVTPQLGYIAHDDYSTLSFEANRRFTINPRDPMNVNALAPGNTTDHASLRARRVWSDLNGVAAQAAFSRSRDLIENPGQLVGIPGAQKHMDAGVRGSRWRLDGGYLIEAWRGYLDVHRFNGSRITWDASFLPVYRRESAVLVGWRQMQIAQGGYTVVRARMAVAGYRLPLTPLVSGQIEVGASDVIRWDGARYQGPGVILSLRGPGFDAGYARAKVTLQPGLPVTADARVERPLPGGNLYLRWESSVTPEAAIGYEPNLTRQVTFGAEDSLSSANLVGGEVGYGHTHPLVSPGLTGQVLRLSGFLERRFRSWISGRGMVTYLDFRTEEPGRPSPVRRIRFDAMVAVHP